MSATVPLFNQAHIPDLSAGGDVQFDKNIYPYFWRTTPGDDVAGYTLAAYVSSAPASPGSRPFFGNDQAAQGNVPGSSRCEAPRPEDRQQRAIALDQTTYETEVQKIIARHPQVIVTESDPQSAGVLLGNLKQAGLDGPVVGSREPRRRLRQAAIAALGKAITRRTSCGSSRTRSSQVPRGRRGRARCSRRAAW